MPLSCPGEQKARYRFKKGTNIRLAFCGNEVKEVKKMKVKSYMPPGGKQSPHGDLGELRQQESARAFKGAGKVVSASKRLPYRTPKTGIDSAFGPGDKVC